MTDPHHDLIEKIRNRNALRTETKLPLLNVEIEASRLAAAREQAVFELEFERRRPEFSHLWTGNNSGWTTNMGRYVLARQQVRRFAGSEPLALTGDSDGDDFVAAVIQRVDD